MLYLIRELIFWLLGVAIAAGVAGWAWQRWRSAGRIEALDERREQLRRELVALVQGGGGGFIELERETTMLRALLDVRDGRIADLERRVEEVRAARDEAQATLAETQRAAPQTILAEATPVADHGRWRLRFLEARVRHLEGLAEAAEDTESALGAARDRATELEQALAQAEDPAELLAARWRVRYLNARVRYLEGPEAAAAAPMPVASLEPSPPSEAELEGMRRKAWRMRYLEARLAHVEEDGAQRLSALARDREAAGQRMQGLESEIGAGKARIAALEAEISRLTGVANEAEAARAALEADAARARRLTWRARYLDARVRHMEGVLAAAAPAPAPARIDAGDAPAPLVAPGKEERPPALPAARFGAPEDLTLIDGVSPMQVSTLNSLGVFHFDQIAAWTPANVAWVDQYLRLRGRITRERWVEQAALLARSDTSARAGRLVHEDA
jgi:predicted flap endonuclease-1-like 5' DNA nuclease/prefoldin subunit 5